MTLGMYILLVLALIAANLPFMSKRFFFFIGSSTKHKHFLLELLECIVYYLLVAIIAYFMESQLGGAVHKQGVTFFVVTFSMFLVFAFPGFVFSHFWHARKLQ